MEVTYISEEKPTSIESINEVEELVGKKVPKEYVEFLLQHNGAICYPNFPSVKADTTWRLWQIDRILSVPDLKVYLTQEAFFDLRDHLRDYDLKQYNLKLESLLMFALGEQGIFLINLDSNDYGRIYFSCFSDWDGLVQFQTNSMKTFLTRLTIEQDQPESYNKEARNMYTSLDHHKCFRPHHFYKDHRKEVMFNRFKECYDYIHYKALEHNPRGRSLLETWMEHHNVVSYLINKGHKPHGIQYTSNYKTIMLLLGGSKDWLYETVKDGNNTYDAPIVRYSRDIKYYRFFHDSLSNGDDIDWGFAGLDGETLLSNLKEMVKTYYKKELKEKELWQNRGLPKEFKPYFESKLINKVIGRKSNWIGKIFRDK